MIRIYQNTQLESFKIINIIRLIEIIFVNRFIY